MANKFLIFGFLIFLSCTHDEPNENIAKDNITLVEDDASKLKTEILKKEVKKVIGLPNVTVELSYKLTGKTQKVQCGWNKTQDMQEINIIKVEIR